MRSFFAFLLVFGFFCSSGQSNPQVNSVVGFDLSNHLDFYSTASIGETLVTTLSENNTIITQGFLQPLLYSPCAEIKVTFYPNPTAKEVTVEAHGCEGKIETLDFYNSWGQLMANIKRPVNNKIDLGHFAPGLYFIQVNLSKGPPQTIKIIKVSN